MSVLKIGGLATPHVHGAGAVVLAVLTAGFAYFQARPVIAARAQAQALTTELAEKRDALKQAQASRKDTAERVAALKAQLADRLVNLVPQSHLNERLEELSQLAESAGVNVDKLSPIEAPPGTPAPGAAGPFPSLQLRLTGRGPYQACERLIASLHSAFADTAVTSLRVKGTPENAGAPVNVDLELLWYTAAEPAGSH